MAEEIVGLVGSDCLSAVHAQVEDCEYRQMLTVVTAFIVKSCHVTFSFLR